MMWFMREIGASFGHPPLLDSKNETNVNSSGFDALRLESEGDALSMHGGHQWAPTYSPNTECPGLDAYIGAIFCSSSSLCGAGSWGNSKTEERGAANSAKKTQNAGFSSGLTTALIGI